MLWPYVLNYYFLHSSPFSLCIVAAFFAACNSLELDYLLTPRLGQDASQTASLPLPLSITCFTFTATVPFMHASTPADARPLCTLCAHISLPLLLQLFPFLASTHHRPYPEPAPFPILDYSPTIPLSTPWLICHIILPSTSLFFLITCRCGVPLISWTLTHPCLLLYLHYLVL